MGRVINNAHMTHAIIVKLYRQVLKAQRVVLAGDHQALLGTVSPSNIKAAQKWTRHRFSTATDHEQLATDMTGLCTFLNRNLAQCRSEDGGKLFKLQWRPSLEVNDVMNSPVRSPCKCT